MRNRSHGTGEYDRASFARCPESVVLEPHVLVFCIAMALVHMAAASYYQLYPLHLTDNLGIGKQWVGLIANIGVVVEIAFMLGFGWLTTMHGWDVEHHEVEIALEDDVVRDVQARVRRTHGSTEPDPVRR